MSLADDFLEPLEQVTQQSQDQWQARCPAHDDRNASLSVSYKHSRLLVHCHAGCAMGDVVIARGWEIADLFEGGDRTSPGTVTLRTDPVPPRKHTPLESRTQLSIPQVYVDHWREQMTPAVAARLTELKGWTLPTLQRLGVGVNFNRVVFFIEDVDGRLIGTVRYQPNPLLRNGESKSLAAGVRALWPDPRTIEADHVWLVEGEPDRVSACELGLDAVALPGVGKWRDEWAAMFAGKTVTVCMDCDLYGRTAAERIPELLEEAGVQARSVDLAPDRDDGFDLSDALLGASRQGRVADLVAYLEQLRGDPPRKQSNDGS